jgi:hypothetical protein
VPGDRVAMAAASPTSAHPGPIPRRIWFGALSIPRTLLVLSASVSRAASTGAARPSRV